MKQLILTTCLGLTLASCSDFESFQQMLYSSDNTTEILQKQGITLHLKAHETTESSVLEVLGTPKVRTTNSDGLDSWTYERPAVMLSEDADAQTWDIRITKGACHKDDHGCVIKYTVLEFNTHKVLLNTRIEKP